jgi:pimeloyl-ACP methyl ester carboxylesterase
MRYVKVGDINVCYDIQGDGFPLVLIMGLTANMEWWDREMLDALSKKYRVVTFDNRGAGRTETPDVGEFTIAMFADDTFGLMDSLGIGRANIAGYSMGGLIAQEMAIKQPERVNRLALCSTFCGGQHMIQAGPEVLKVLMDTSGGIEGRCDRALSLMFDGEYLDANPDFVKTFRERYLRAPTSIKNGMRQFMACAKSSTFGRLNEITAPVLVTTGTDDILILPQNSRKLADNIPGARLVEYKGGGHGMMHQMRDQFVKDLMAFFAS